VHINLKFKKSGGLFRYIKAEIDLEHTFDRTAELEYLEQLISWLLTKDLNKKK